MQLVLVLVDAAGAASVHRNSTSSSLELSHRSCSDAGPRHGFRVRSTRQLRVGRLSGQTSLMGVSTREMPEDMIYCYCCLLPAFVLCAYCANIRGRWMQHSPPLAPNERVIQIR
jgi:hypothetical protein